MIRSGARIVVSAATALALVHAPASSDALFPGKTMRVSVADDEAEANGASFAPDISGDGTRIAFASDASNLVTDDANGARDVFVRDRASSATVRVSARADGMEASGHVDWDVSISANGRWVGFSRSLFASASSEAGAFLANVDTGHVERISITASGAPIAGANNVHVDADASSAVFKASGDLWRWTRASGYAEPLLDDGGARVRGGDFRVSEDGSTIVIERRFPGPVFGIVYAFDVATGRYEQISDGETFSFAAAVDADGSTVVYLRVPPDSFIADVVVVDRATGVIDALASAAEPMSAPDVSADGRWVTFENLFLSANPASVVPGIYIWDRVDGSIMPLSFDTNGAPSAIAPGAHALAGDAGAIAYATDVALSPNDTNGKQDVYLRDRTVPCDIACVR